MEKTLAVSALGALAHEGRLDIFRLLVRAGAEGMAAGDIARATDAAASTQSANLTILSRAGLIMSRRAGRSIIYSAAYDQMRDLLGFLMEDCCGGNPAICAPLAALASQPCGAEGKTC
ncbi:MAG: metalloregulator ArsR/SmtB family transcription factor [Alphaproteobacteria bacterium]|nr:metalloregulator ArsR/SmtB family transcription factor [Alphaproteobacteria bacterium]MBU1514804.1 metalloregulator ArsR/SmtB family transcription factor [Alphaproteobacteria bacterium]MBU2093935.1 metalloregulator ArsR/SmtB family transcription factor [Alphaproteobacteria bacterium]MBU2153362.1 metalloregulator ArsR/SmtB family transcription factor [Alphaproteobacteria bacterium]MBU2309790.1 metalloregulator ArsR/SmtB family transcription factor [Alphaproteobacteria bacterium]